MNFNRMTEGWVVEGPNEEGQYWIGVQERCACGHECCSKPVIGVRPHTGGQLFDDCDEAYEYIDEMTDRWEQQYDQYLEENHYAIVQTERYEMWQREY